MLDYEISEIIPLHHLPTYNLNKLKVNLNFYSTYSGVARNQS